MPEMPTITRISSIWPPTPEHIHCITFEHRDGRRIDYIRGLASSNPAQEALLAKRGNITGTVGSVELWEAFPDEPVCRGCVAPVARYNIKADGTHTDWWATSGPDFTHGVRSGYCPACLERETAKVRAKYELDMRYLGHTGGKA